MGLAELLYSANAEDSEGMKVFSLPWGQVCKQEHLLQKPLLIELVWGSVDNDVNRDYYKNLNCIHYDTDFRPLELNQGTGLHQKEQVLSVHYKG